MFSGWPRTRGLIFRDTLLVERSSALMDALLEVNWLYLLVAAFAGGAFGASVGALPAFAFTGLMVIAGEAANLIGEVVAAEVGGLAAANMGVGITGSVAFGPVFGPHISFAGGAAAAAYAAKKGYMNTGFPFHMAKDITFAHGTKVDVLVVGGLFGVLGALIRQGSAAFGLPWDPIALGVVLSALAHRLTFGYDLIGPVGGAGLLDMSPFARGEERSGSGDGADPGAPDDRFVVEPWLPHQYKWGSVAMLGLVAGLLGAYTALETGSPFLAFGISAASLLFLNLGVVQFPVTHHITLPASTAALAVAASGADVQPAVISNTSSFSALGVGAVFGVVCALFGELFQRVFYAHGDTHWDPPAAAIVFGTFLIAILYLTGVFGTTVWVPVP